MKTLNEKFKEVTGSPVSLWVFILVLIGFPLFSFYLGKDILTGTLMGLAITASSLPRFRRFYYIFMAVLLITAVFSNGDPAWKVTALILAAAYIYKYIKYVKKKKLA